MKNSKKILLASLLIAAEYSTLASAHTQSGALGISTSGAAATDVYVVTCGLGSARLFLRVIDLAPVLSPSISIQAAKANRASALAVDVVDGDANYSTAVVLARGAGTYQMTVNKPASTSKGQELYKAEFHARIAQAIIPKRTWV